MTLFIVHYRLTIKVIELYLKRLGCRFAGWDKSVGIKVDTDHLLASSFITYKWKTYKYLFVNNNQQFIHF